jgi:hypothetical protein
LGAADGALLRGRTLEAALGRRPCASGSLRRRASRKQARWVRGFGSDSGGLVKGSRAHEASFRLTPKRDSIDLRERKRRPLSAGGTTSTRHEVSEVRWIGVCPAPAREIAAGWRSARRKPGDRAPGPQASATSPRKRRSYPETTSGEGNLAAARVTSRHREAGFGLFPSRRSAGVQSIPGRARGSHWIAELEASFRASSLRTRSRRAPRKRGDAAERSLGRAPCASEVLVMMGPPAAPGLGPSRARDGG